MPSALCWALERQRWGELKEHPNVSKIDIKQIECYEGEAEGTMIAHLFIYRCWEIEKTKWEQGESSSSNQTCWDPTWVRTPIKSSPHAKWKLFVGNRRLISTGTWWGRCSGILEKVSPPPQQRLYLPTNLTQKTPTRHSHTPGLLGDGQAGSYR